MRCVELRWLAALFVTALFPILSHAESNDVERQLREHYRDKNLVVRNFYPGDTLRFDSSGALKEGGGPGDWTVFGFVRITDIRVTHGLIEINAKRLFVKADDKKQFDFVADTRKMLENPHFVKIQAELPANASTDDAHDAMARIFLSARDNFAGVVPDFWRTCVRAAYNPIVNPKQNLCHFSSSILSVPGVGLSSAAETEPQVMASEPVFRVGKGVSPPRQTFGSEPEFTDAAREAEVQGTVTLAFVLDSSGTPRNISVVSPRGCGLDAQAVQALRTWRFQPATKAGKPVAVQIGVEVSFRRS